MSENKNEWHKNIPENGVLCKFSGVHDEDVIMAVTQQMVEDANAEPTEEDLKKIRPLTAQEWWQFAPFQAMKTAPENKELLLLDNDGFIVPIDKISKGRVECHGDELSLSNFKGWLPLPEESQ